MTEPAIGTLEVPGASPRYEVRGAGPVLLLIVGGGGDAGIFEPVADALADRFTVVTYDPRGHSRSPLDGPDVDQRVETQADDAYRLLERVAPDGPPAYVFGTSSGAIVAVELLTRHPERLARVVAHEPVLVSLLPDAAEQHTFFSQVVSAFHRAGVDAAMAEMGAGRGEHPRREPGCSPRCRGCGGTRRSSWAGSWGSSAPTHRIWPDSTPVRASWCPPRAGRRTGCGCTGPRRGWPSGTGSLSRSSPGATSVW
ncbi:alpha/beta fold hydrolase [Streptomyces sp. NPDC002221]|uniref:alpha/beta fold hydrolase n=1 Tax=Streptomyces sp. NPDC002221 TaxID=3364639 RepID=UPI0036B61EA8